MASEKRVERKAQNRAHSRCDGVRGDGSCNRNVGVEAGVPEKCGNNRKNCVTRVDLEAETGQGSIEVGQVLPNHQPVVPRDAKIRKGEAVRDCTREWVWRGAVGGDFVCNDCNRDGTIWLVVRMRREGDR